MSLNESERERLRGIRFRVVSSSSIHSLIKHRPPLLLLLVCNAEEI